MTWSQLRSPQASPKLLQCIAAGSRANVRFTDLQRLAEACGFELQRVAGSHHVHLHPEIDAVLNLEDIGSHAEPYRVRQYLRLVERYGLRPEDHT